MKQHFSMLIILMLCTLSSCDSQQKEQGKIGLSGEGVSRGKLLATIDGKKIYEPELQSLLVDMFGEYQAQTMDDTSRKRALDSLIASHALVREAEKQLSAETISDVDLKAARYRDNQLINAYMKTKISPASLTNEHIRTYYENNLEKFGKRTIKKIQAMTTRNELPEELRESYLSHLAETMKTGDLEKISKAMKVKGYEVHVQSAELNMSLLDERLYQFINAQKLDMLSELTFINGRPYLVRVISQKVVAAKPLSQVSASIRSEERRVGKEFRSRWSPDNDNK